MKAVCKLFSLGTCFLSIWGGTAQAQFQNLDFETANIPPFLPPGSDFGGLPYWTSTYIVIYDGVSTGGNAITLNDSHPQFVNVSPLQGNYSVILWAGLDTAHPNNPITSISQTDRVPANARSIQMDVAKLNFNNSSIPSGPFTVSLGGQLINMVPLQAFPNYTVYGGDVSAFAGLFENLTISQFPPADPHLAPSATEFDDIVFSPNLVPEPSVWALLLLSAGIFTTVRFRR